MDSWVWQSPFYGFKREENKEQHPHVDTQWPPCDSGLEVEAGRGGWMRGLRKRPRRGVHMEPLFHGLIWEPEHSELGIELWLWLEN